MKTGAISFSLLAISVLVLDGLQAGVLFGQSRILGAHELTDQAEIVAVGTVAGMKPEWNADKTRIFTRVTVSVSEILKGGGEQQLSILTPGGEIGEVGEMYFGTPRFAKDEEVVVFVKKGPDRVFTVVGGAQGKATITRETTTGAKMVGQTMKLDELVANVKAALRAPRPEEKKP